MMLKTYMNCSYVSVISSDIEVLQSTISVTLWKSYRPLHFPSNQGIIAFTLNRIVHGVFLTATKQLFFARQSPVCIKHSGQD